MLFEGFPISLFYALGGIVGCWIMIGISGALPALSLWKARFDPLTDKEAQFYLQQVLSSGRVSVDWLSSEGFQPAGILRIHSFMRPVVIGWRHAQRSTWVLFYVILETATAFDIISNFDDGSRLATCSTRDAQLFPTRPHVWMQSFTASSADELWSHHQAAIQYLKETSERNIAEDDKTLAEAMQETFQLQSRYIRSIPFWILRIPYWYFVRRFTLHGKPLADLMRSA
jgi:hypothetical protein